MSRKRQAPRGPATSPGAEETTHINAGDSRLRQPEPAAPPPRCAFLLLLLNTLVKDQRGATYKKKKKASQANSSHNRFNSGLHQRDSRSALFEGYTGPGADSSRRGVTPSPNRLGGGYGYGYPGANGTGSGSGSGTANGHLGVENRGFRPATPNKRSVALLRRIERATRMHGTATGGSLTGAKIREQGNCRGWSADKTEGRTGANTVMRC